MVNLARPEPYIPQNDSSFLLLVIERMHTAFVLLYRFRSEGSNKAVPMNGLPCYCLCMS